MTVSATDLAFLHFSLDAFPRPRCIHQLTNAAEFLASNMIELKNNWIRFPAIDAWILSQIV